MISIRPTFLTKNVVSRRYRSSITTAAYTKKNKVEFATVHKLTVNKPYESQILASVKNWKGERLASYNLTANAESDIVQFNCQFKQFWKDIPDGVQKLSKKEYKRSDDFECDFYFKPDDDDIGSINELLRGGVEQLHLKFGEPVSNVSGRWCFCEITESPDHIYKKLFQLERAVYFLTRANPHFEISGCVILINGSEEAATAAIESFSVPKDCDIVRKQIPVYIGWVPTRNVYLSISNMESNQAALKTDVAALKSDVAALKTDVAALKTDVAELKTDVAELKTDMAELKQMFRELVARK